MSSEGSRLEYGELDEREFEDFLAAIAPTLEQSVSRLGVAGHLGVRASAVDASKTITVWPDIADRVIEEMR